MVLGGSTQRTGSVIISKNSNSLQSTGAISTRFGVTVLSTSLYSCNFLHKRRVETKFLPISSTVYFAPEELDLCLKSFSVRPVKFVNRRGAISTAEICCRQALASRRAYSLSLEDWYCCVQNRLLYTLVLVSVVCALLFLSYKQNKKLIHIV